MAIEYKVIGRHIRAARTNKQMTQEAVAEAIDMSCAHFGKVERGERPINLQRLAQLSALLEIPLEALVEGAVVADGSVFSHGNLPDRSGFMDAVENIAKGCSEYSLRLMLRLCTAVAEEDKSGRSI
jgi:transcriptional regulator with XRE-family HTH domain